MKIVDLIQGSSKWHAHRDSHFNASEAAAMMGASPYMTRAELLRIKAGGESAEVSSFQQGLFDRGHETEARARALLEQETGIGLYPVVGVSDEHPRLSASYDGMDMDEEVSLEHKLWNQALVESVLSGAVKDNPAYFWQLEHQLVVCPTLKAIKFVCSDGTADNRAIFLYERVPGRAEELLAGWALFEEDLAKFTPETPVAEVVGRAMDSLPALRIEAEGRITVSNLDAFTEHALAVIEGINTNLQTDQDFADAEKAVKWCEDVESRVQVAKEAVLAQTVSIEEAFRSLDSVSGAARTKRLTMKSLVQAQKDLRRQEIQQAGQQELFDHMAALNERLGGHVTMPPVKADLAGAMRGKRTITSLKDAVSAELARVKLEANRIADGMQINLRTLEAAAEYNFLFNDIQQVITKPTDDFKLLVESRVSNHKKQEERRLEQERERIAEEERERLLQQQQAQAPATAAPVVSAPAAPAPAPAPAPADQVSPLPSTATTAKRRVSGWSMIQVLALHYRQHESAIVQRLLDDMPEIDRMLKEAI